jgi:hypothetical protein
MLRADEGEGYWTSPAPAVALQFGMYYVHYVHDCFSLIEYYAFNQPLYEKRQFGPHQGYRGGHPWRDTTRGHQAVVVDGLQIQPIDDGNRGCEHQHIRSGFSETVKFAAVRAKPYDTGAKDAGGLPARKGLFPDADLERALFLTKEYLLDIFRCASDRPRRYHWNVHPLGAPQLAAEEKWEASGEFNGGKLWSGEMAVRTKSGDFDLRKVKKREVGEAAWSFPVKKENGVGVRVHMLGEPETTLFHDSDGEITTIIVERKKPATVFVALHEHFKGAPGAAATFERLAQNEQGCAVKIAGLGAADDRVLLAYAAHAAEPVTLAGGGERFTFTGHAHIRLGRDVVTVSGNLAEMEVRVRGEPKLLLNGKEVPVKIRDGVLTLGTR